MPIEPCLNVVISSLETRVISSDETEAVAGWLRRDLRDRCRAVNRRDREAWTEINSREDWERFCTPRIEALRKSLGIFPPEHEDLNVRVTGTINGDGYDIQKLLYESRSGVYVTANLYIPSPSGRKMPAVIIVHSHHNPKTQGELQDMGMTWARSGCAVLVIDQLSYGERGEHRPGPRQDYRFRYINGIRLHVMGESLMGWMVWDTMRGIDLLLNRGDVDEEKIILIGAVAGGGDVAAVAAAIDKRVTCVIPFNFGGPQPETQYPLPDDAEETFNYMGHGSWESTRNLRLSGRDGFLPWIIVASVAPRYLIYAHEFSWDKERDPVWKRLQKVFAFYNASDNLDLAHGAGVLSGRPPEATHCNNVGPIHRRMIYPALRRWLGIPVPQEYQNRLPAEELVCFTPELRNTLELQPLHELYAEMGEERAAAIMRESLAELTPEDKRHRLRRKWTELLGNVEPEAEPAVKSISAQDFGSIRVERIMLRSGSGIVLPVLGFMPLLKGRSLPLVVALAQGGKAGFLKERCAHITELLKKGVAVYIPDVRGMGELSIGSSHERQSEATSVSATEWMLGQTLLGSQLRDVRSILRYLHTRSDLDAKRIAIWGDSFAHTNPGNFSDPLIGEGESPYYSGPVGGLLGLFSALYEESICAVAVRGMIAGYRSLLLDRYCYVPHSAIVPGALTAGDLCDIAAALAPRPLRIEAPVDGRNCRVLDQELQRHFGPTLEAYSKTVGKLSLVPTSEDDLATWLVESLSN